MKDLLTRFRQRLYSPVSRRFDEVNAKLAEIEAQLNERRVKSPRGQSVVEPYPERAFPSLESKHMPEARLFANRNDLIGSLTSVRGGVVAEIGVAQGEFSQILLNELQPSKFFALDTFELHLIPVIWGIPTEELLEGKLHLEFYRDRFSSLGERVVIQQGLSHESLQKLPDESFDLIYIDAGHDYENVKRDADLSQQKLKREGVLIFNDYIMFDHIRQVPYGVVQAVNEMVAGGGWRVIALALHHDLFCDIAVARSTSDIRC